MVGLLVMFSLRCAAGHIAVPPMPASPFADTEISTNVAFKTGVHGVQEDLCPEHRDDGQQGIIK